MEDDGSPLFRVMRTLVLPFPFQLCHYLLRAWRGGGRRCASLKGFGFAVPLHGLRVGNCPLGGAGEMARSVGIRIDIEEIG